MVKAGGGPKVSIGGGSRAELGLSSTGFSSRNLAKFSSGTAELAGSKLTGPKTAKYGSHMSSGEFKGPKLDVGVRSGGIHKVDTGSAKRAETPSPRANIMPESLIRTVKQPDATLGQLREPRVVVKGLEPKPFVSSKTDNKTDSTPKPRGNSIQRAWTDAPRALDTTPKSRGISADTNRIVLPPPMDKGVAEVMKNVPTFVRPEITQPKQSVLPTQQESPVDAPKEQTEQQSRSEPPRSEAVPAPFVSTPQEAVQLKPAPTEVEPVVVPQPIAPEVKPLIPPEVPSVVPKVAPLGPSIVVPMAKNETRPAENTPSNVINLAEARARLRPLQTEQPQVQEITKPSEVVVPQPVDVQPRVTQPEVAAPTTIPTVRKEVQRLGRKTFQSELAGFVAKREAMRVARVVPDVVGEPAPFPLIVPGSDPQVVSERTSVSAGAVVLELEEEEQKSRKAQVRRFWARLFQRAVLKQAVKTETQPQALAQVISPAEKRQEKAQPEKKQSQKGERPTEAEVIVFEARVRMNVQTEPVVAEEEKDEKKPVVVEHKPATKNRLKKLSDALSRLFGWWDLTSTRNGKEIIAAMDPSDVGSKSDISLLQGREHDGSEEGPEGYRNEIAQNDNEMTKSQWWSFGMGRISANKPGIVKKDDGKNELSNAQIRKILGQVEKETSPRLVA